MYWLPGANTPEGVIVTVLEAGSKPTEEVSVVEPELSVNVDELTVEGSRASLNWMRMEESRETPSWSAAGVTETIAGGFASGRTVKLADAVCVVSA